MAVTVMTLIHLRCHIIRLGAAWSKTFESFNLRMIDFTNHWQNFRQNIRILPKFPLSPQTRLKPQLEFRKRHAGWQPLLHKFYSQLQSDKNITINIHSAYISINIHSATAFCQHFPLKLLHCIVSRNTNINICSIMLEAKRE